MERTMKNVNLIRISMSVVAGFGLCLGLASCALYRPGRPEGWVREPSESYSRSLPGSAEISRWWESFHDPDLNALVELALTNNFDVARAWARLDQAWATARQAGGDRWPQLNAEAGARRAKTISTATGEAVEADQFSLGLAASYEVDLWGRVASLNQAARYDYQATRNELEAAAMTVAAEMASAWVEAREQAAQQVLLGEQLKASQTYLQLTESRFAQGQVSALDVFQQRQQEGAIQLLLPPVAARLDVLRHQMAYLAGRTPGEWTDVPPAFLPEPPALPDAGVPAALLTQRPDVRAAMDRLAAADQRLAAAVANRLPAIRLTAGAGYQSAETADLFKDWIWNLAGNLVAPVLDGGKRAAEAERARAALREQAATAGQALLKAIREVEDALVQESQQAESVRRQEAQWKLAGDTLRESRARYLAGLSEYLPVLLALDRQQAAGRSVLAARRQWILYRIQLYRALGGDWTRDLPRVEAHKEAL